MSSLFGRTRVALALFTTVVVGGAVACGPSQRRSSGIQVGTGEAGPAGSWAHAFLQSQPYSSVAVTVDYVPGEEPSPGALSLLQRRLAERCHKPAGVTVALGRAIQGKSGGEYTDSDALEEGVSNRQVHSSGSTLSLYVTYLDGHSTRDHDGYTTVGLALEATYFCVFEESVRAQAPAAGVAPEQCEAAVLLQELGHLVGLVGLGSPLTSDHQDPAHTDHCANPECVMNWLISGANSGRVGGLEAIDFDAACKADLAANGGR